MQQLIERLSAGIDSSCADEQVLKIFGCFADLFLGSNWAEEVAAIDANLSQNACNELILRLIAHPNIGRLICPRRSLSQILKIAECMPGERLFDNLHNVSDRPMLLKCAIDICTGITHLHPKAMKHQLYDKKAYAHTFGCCLYLHFYLASGSSVLLEVDLANVFRLVGYCVEWPQLCKTTEYISRRSLFDFLPNFSDFPIVMYFGVDMCQNQNDVMADDTGAYRWMVTEIKNSQPYDNESDISKIPCNTINLLQAAIGVRQGLYPQFPENELNCWRNAGTWEADTSYGPSSLMQFVN